MSKLTNYAELTADALKKELDELLAERFNIHMQKVTGQAVKTHMLKQIRRNIARIKTALLAKGVKL